MDYEIIELPKIVDPRGNLTVAEQMKNVPFDIKRVYWTYDVPGGESRGGHAHKNLYQLVVAMSGSFTVTLDDGETSETSCSIIRGRGCSSNQACGERWTISPLVLCVWCWPVNCSTWTITFTNTTSS